MSDIVRKAAAVLLVAVLSLTAGMVPRSRAAANTRTCECCTAENGACAMPACCKAQPPDGKPYSPASAPSRTGTDLQWLALWSPSGLINSGSSNLPQVVSQAFVLQDRHVPIFQRDCSYLI